MDAKEHKMRAKEFVEALRRMRNENMKADRAVHSEDSRVKYDPATGSLKEEK